MSSVRMETIRCPTCAREAEFETWTSLNVTLDPAKKAKLLSRELFQFKCPDCATVTDIVYPMLYHDMDARRMIYLIPDAPDGSRQPAPRGFDPGMMDAMAADGYQFRLVGSHNELVEKVLIIDAGLEDGPMELLKLALRDKLPPELAEGAVDVYFSKKLPADAARGQPEKLELVVVSLVRARGAEVPLEPIYSTMVRAWAPLAPTDPHQWPRIDRSYVLSAIERRGSRAAN